MASSNAVSDLFAGAGANTQRVLEAVRQHLAMDVAFVGRLQDGRREFTHVDAGVDAGIRPGDSDPLEETYCARVIDGRLPEVIPDASALPEALRIRATLELPVGAHISVPIRLSDGTVYGTFCCFSLKPDPDLDSRDLGLMRVLADLVAQNVEGEARDEAARMDQHDALDSVLRPGGMRIVYQPIVSLGDQAIRGYEALARFHAGSPVEWFARAEALGRRAELEMRAVSLALRGAEQIDHGRYLSFNVSPDVLLTPEFESAVARSTGQLVVEITEHAAVGDYTKLWMALDPLRQRGIRIAIDDMGAGFSSLSHVLRLNPDILKLDRALVEGIDRDAARQAMAVALVRFGTSTRSHVLAEGVETALELSTLIDLGVSFGQGYHLGRPGELTAAEEVAKAG